MQDMGAYEILSHVAMAECSIRIIRMQPAGNVASHYHERSVQVYTVLEHEVEVVLGDQTMHLRPYETVRIDRNEVHSIRAIDGAALVMSLSIPPMDRDDQHAVS